ncbi:MAG TPA: hypothetical protein VG164_04935 [Trebonia sp.]|jgi:hypothetical protein|nr:hypothetical protein [Trebonia sp.]
MTNMYTGNGQDGRPTAPYRVPTAGDGDPGSRPRRSRARQAGAALLVCAAVGGVTFAVVEAVSGPASAGTPAVARAGQPAQGTQAALLRSALTPAGRRWAVRRIRALGGMYGQFTYETKKNGARTLAFERGTVTLVTSSDVVIRAKDGTTETWALSGTSVVRENGTKEPASTLAQGQTVFAGGPLTGSTRGARVVVIRKAS